MKGNLYLYPFQCHPLTFMSNFAFNTITLYKVKPSTFTEMYRSESRCRYSYNGYYMPDKDVTCTKFV